MLKRILSVVLMLALLTSTAYAEAAQPQIITTIFPAYDFARTLFGEHADVRLLLAPGTESHSYEPTPQDMIAIQNADLFLYNGGESDAWVADLLSSMGDKAPKTLTMMSCVSVLDEEHTAAMSGEAEAEAEPDEHVWTSPLNAIQIVRAIGEEACALLPDAADELHANTEAYCAQLQALDDDFHAVVENGVRKTVVFGDRFPLRYLIEELGLDYEAAFPGCSEDTEPSAKTVVALVEKVRQEQLPVVFYIEFSSRKTADVIAEETGAKTMLFHSCHNVSQEEMDAGATYLSLMQNNVSALKEALN